MLTDDQVATTLSGDEHGCAFDQGFTLAVPRSMMHHPDPARRHVQPHGHPHGHVHPHDGAARHAAAAGPANRSGVSFGGVQLDVGNNDDGAAAFREMLAYGVGKGALTVDEAVHFSRYVGVKRPDLNRELGPHVERDLRDLNAKLYFNPVTHDGVKAISARHQSAYVSREVTPAMNRFLDSHKSFPLFSPGHPDYRRAVSGMLSRLNRGGQRSFAATTRLVDHHGPRLDLAGLSRILGHGVDPSLAAVGASDLADFDRAVHDGATGPIPRSACRPRPRSVASLGR